MSLLDIQQLHVPGLAPLDLRLEAGECITLTGASGSGKSLLLRAIADIDAAPGEIRLDGTSRNAMPAPQWRRQVVLVPAESRWWYRSVGEHFPASNSIDPGAFGFTAAVMDWRVSRLSTGEKQRLGILRALAVNPRVLLLDEPTASVDADNVQRIEQRIADLRRDRGCAVIWVTHDAAQAHRIASRHLVIRHGRVETAA